MPSPQPQPGRGCLAVFLSALVLPGTGQWLQRRRAAAAVFAGAFLVAFGFAVRGLWRMLDILRTDLAGAAESPPFAPADLLPPVLIPVGIALGIAVLSVADVILAARRTAAPPPPAREKA